MLFLQLVSGWVAELQTSESHGWAVPRRQSRSLNPATRLKPNPPHLPGVYRQSASRLNSSDMDPLSILSIAAAVVAFVDFGGKLVGAARDYVKRGDPSDVTAGLADLARDSGQLGRLGRQIESAQGKPESSAVSQNPEFEAVLGEVARESALVAQGVRDLVLKLQTDDENRKNASLGRHLFNTVKGGAAVYATIETNLRNAEQRLGRINSAMISAVLGCLWYVWPGPLSLPVGLCCLTPRHQGRFEIHGTRHSQHLALPWPGECQFPALGAHDGVVLPGREEDPARER